MPNREAVGNEVAEILHRVATSMEKIMELLRTQLNTPVLFVSPPGMLYGSSALQQFVYLLTEVCATRRIEVYSVQPTCTLGKTTCVQSHYHLTRFWQQYPVCYSRLNGVAMPSWLGMTPSITSTGCGREVWLLTRKGNTGRARTHAQIQMVSPRGPPHHRKGGPCHRMGPKWQLDSGSGSWADDTTSLFCLQYRNYQTAHEFASYCCPGSHGPRTGYISTRDHIWRMVPAESSGGNSTNSSLSAVCLTSHSDDEFRPGLELGRHHRQVQTERPTDKIADRNYSRTHDYQRSASAPAGFRTHLVRG